MALTSGTKLGPYEIVSPLGAGGMGEVYRAQDTRLDRTIAIKILPTHLSQNAEARERFDREARAISSLNHPNICHLYDVGQQDGISYLVLEYLEGETLADCLRKGPLPLEQVLKVGVEICEGLEKAHRSGVVHRDLKPSNIMLTKSGAKLMDFGLAKSPVAAVAAGSSSDSLATMSRPLTAEGTIIGTFHYMSPEQVEGREADPRSDIFSLGTVLYEMVTGKRAFEGKTTASTIAAILAAEPKPISAIQPMFPPALEHVTKACLAKDPDERFQTAHDVKVELHWIAQTVSQSGETGRIPIRRSRSERVAWLLATTFFLVTILSGVALWKASNRRPAPMHFYASVPFAADDLALSPDGRMVAMVAYSAQANGYVLWIHEIGSQRANPLEGTHGASYPFWSPDSMSLGFFAAGKLKRVDLFGGEPQVLCDAPTGRGGTWNRNGVIVFAPQPFGGLFRVPAWGGTPVEVTSTDPARLEQSHRWPMFLPDETHFLYLAANFSGQTGDDAIFIGSLDSREKRLVVATSANAGYAEPGYLLYTRKKTLVAQPFDRRHYVLIGEPRTLSNDVAFLAQVDRAVFSVAGSQVLITQAGKGASTSQLMWVDRSGKPEGTLGKAVWWDNVRLSPDGRKIAADQTDPEGGSTHIWIHDSNRGATMRLTFNPYLDQVPIWSPDGRQILFSSNRSLHFHILLKDADGSGSEEDLADVASAAQLNVNAWDWSRDGKYALIKKGNELWYLGFPEHVLKPLIQEKWTVQNAQFSPDGRWIAYASNETGNMEIHVTRFPHVTGKWQVSSAGGEEPRWRRDGKELFYLSPEGKVMAVPVTTGVSFEAGTPVALFQTHCRQAISAQDVFSYDVSADGQRFLIDTKVDEGNAAPPSIILNWASEMER